MVVYSFYQFFSVHQAVEKVNLSDLASTGFMLWAVGPSSAPAAHMTSLLDLLRVRDMSSNNRARPRSDVAPPHSAPNADSPRCAPPLYQQSRSMPEPTGAPLMRNYKIWIETGFVPGALFKNHPTFFSTFHLASRPEQACDSSNYT